MSPYTPNLEIWWSSLHPIHTCWFHLLNISWILLIPDYQCPYWRNPHLDDNSICPCFPAYSPQSCQCDVFLIQILPSFPLFTKTPLPKGQLAWLLKISKNMVSAHLFCISGFREKKKTIGCSLWEHQERSNQLGRKRIRTVHSTSEQFCNKHQQYFSFFKMVGMLIYKLSNETAQENIAGQAHTWASFYSAKESVCLP